jgi:hypothetical protein
MQGTIDINLCLRFIRPLNGSMINRRRYLFLYGEQNLLRHLTGHNAPQK